MNLRFNNMDIQFDDLATTALTHRRKPKNKTDQLRKSFTLSAKEIEAEKENRQTVIERISKLFELDTEESEGADLVYKLKDSSMLYLIVTPLFVSVRPLCPSDTYETKRIALKDMASQEIKNLLLYLLTN